VAAPFDISLNSVSKHIRLLGRAGLLRRRIAGRDHFLALEPKPFDDLTRWMHETREFWNSRLDALEAALHAEDAIEKARKRRSE
jgi:DNA-binding transcriptional ArsR family regulator